MTSALSPFRTPSPSHLLPAARYALSAALAVGGLAAGATVCAAADVSAGRGMVMMSLPAPPAAVSAYWTPERMRNALSLIHI